MIQMSQGLKSIHNTPLPRGGGLAHHQSCISYPCDKRMGSQVQFLGTSLPMMAGIWTKHQCCEESRKGQRAIPKTYARALRALGIESAIDVTTICPSNINTSTTTAIQARRSPFPRVHRKTFHSPTLSLSCRMPIELIFKLFPGRASIVIIRIHVFFVDFTPPRVPPTNSSLQWRFSWTGKWAINTRKSANALGYAIIPPMADKPAPDTTSISRNILLSRIVAVPLAGQRWCNAGRGIHACPFSVCKSNADLTTLMMTRNT